MHSHPIKNRRAFLTGMAAFGLTGLTGCGGGGDQSTEIKVFQLKCAMAS